MKRDSAKQDSAKGDSAKRDSANRDSAIRDSAKRNASFSRCVHCIVLYTFYMLSCVHACVCLFIYLFFSGIYTRMCCSLVSCVHACVYLFICFSLVSIHACVVLWCRVKRMPLPDNALIMHNESTIIKQ